MMQTKPGEQTRYVLWYRRLNFGKEITGCVPNVFVKAAHAIEYGEEQRERGEWIDYNFSVVYSPVLEGRKENAKSGKATPGMVSL